MRRASYILGSFIVAVVFFTGCSSKQPTSTLTSSPTVNLGPINSRLGTIDQRLGRVESDLTAVQENLKEVNSRLDNSGRDASSHSHYPVKFKFKNVFLEPMSPEDKETRKKFLSELERYLHSIGISKETPRPPEEADFAFTVAPETWPNGGLKDIQNVIDCLAGDNDKSKCPDGVEGPLDDEQVPLVLHKYFPHPDSGMYTYVSTAGVSDTASTSTEQGEAVCPVVPRTRTATYTLTVSAAKYVKSSAVHNARAWIHAPDFQDGLIGRDGRNKGGVTEYHKEHVETRTDQIDCNGDIVTSGGDLPDKLDDIYVMIVSRVDKVEPRQRVRNGRIVIVQEKAGDGGVVQYRGITVRRNAYQRDRQLPVGHPTEQPACPPPPIPSEVSSEFRSVLSVLGDDCQ